MFTRINGLWGAVGVVFALIALFLVLDKAGGASRLLNSSFTGFTTLARTLQGRR